MAQQTNFRPKKECPFLGPNAFDLVAFTIGAKSVNTINVAAQLQDAHGKSIAVPASARVFLSDASTGLGITATATTSALAIGTNGNLLLVDVTGKMCSVQSDASGRFDLNVIQSVSPTTYYMVVEMPDGSIAVSGAITF